MGAPQDPSSKKSAVGLLREQAEQRLDDLLKEEDKELQNAAKTLSESKVLEKQGGQLEPQEKAVVGGDDLKVEEDLEAKERRLQSQLQDAEPRLGKEESELESQRAFLLKEEERLLSKAREVQREESELREERMALEVESEKLEGSEVRLRKD